MERELDVTITVNEDGSGDINVFCSDCGDSVTFDVGADVNCNDADELAKKIGYEFLSWINMAREDMEEEA